MSSNPFTPMEIDAIGEIMNISLGSSATAISNLLDHRVDITTPRVSVVDAEEFSLGEMKPAIGVEIKYVAGLTGSNIMLLKMKDVKVIVDILMGMETPDEEFELNELTISAVCEVMNQMMGASSTALSDFLGRVVNISTPQTFDGSSVENLREKWLPVKNGPIVVVEFSLNIEGSLESAFINIMNVELAKEMVSGFGLGEFEDSSHVLESTLPEGANKTLNQDEIEAMLAASSKASVEASSGASSLSQEEIERLMSGGMGAPAPAPAAPSGGGGGGVLSQEEIERLMSGAAASAPAPAPAAPSGSGGGGVLSQEEIERLMSGAAQPQAAAPAQPQQPPMQPPAGMQQPPQGYYPPPPYWGMPPGGQYPYYPPQPPAQQAPAPAAPEPKVIHTQAPPLPTLADGTVLTEDQSHNLDLIMGVPLEISVEIGRTRKKVQEIMALSKGSLVVLDKLAGDQVDIYVNGRCIASGDVVVIDDNFGIRVTEIFQRPLVEELS